MREVYSDEAWKDYLYWQSFSEVIPLRINELIQDIKRSPYEGLGKPQELHASLSGLWSRRINLSNRMIYSIEGDELRIYSLRDHKP